MLLYNYGGVKMVDSVKCNRKTYWKIRRFARKNKCSMNDFVYILQQAGLKFPGELTDQKGEFYPSFTWTTKFDKDWTIRLIEDNHRFLLTNGRDQFLYRIVSDDGEKIALLLNHTIIRSEYEEGYGRLETNYEVKGKGFEKSVELSNLSIKIVAGQELRSRERRNHESIDKYLLELDNCKVQTIFGKLLKLLEIMQEEDVNLTVTFSKHFFGKKPEFVIENGSYKSYAFWEDGILYQLYFNGDWEYKDPSLEVEKTNSNINFHIYNAEILYIDMKKKLQEIEKKASKLFEEVNWN